MNTGMHLDYGKVRLYRMAGAVARFIFAMMVVTAAIAAFQMIEEDKTGRGDGYQRNRAPTLMMSNGIDFYQNRFSGK